MLIKLDDETNLVKSGKDWYIIYHSRIVDESYLDFHHYQGWSKETAIYPKDKSLEYLGLKLCGESGEVAQIIGKWLPGDYELDDEHKEMLKKELGDVAWYMSQLCTELGLSLDDVFGTNLYKLFDRKARGVLKGNGDDR